MTAISAVMLVSVGYTQEPSATAESEAEAEAKPSAKGAIEVGAITATSKVTKIDASKRTVTLINEAGETNTYKVGKNVRNFDEIKVGDRVKVTLVESVAVTVSKSGTTPAAGARGVVAVAPKGAMPGIIMTKTREITAKIVSVDLQARTVTVEGPMGGKPTIKVRTKS